MKILTFELKVAVEDTTTHHQFQEQISNLIDEDDHLADNFLFLHNLRFLRGRYVDGVKDPNPEDVTDPAMDDWYSRANKELE